MNEKVLSGYSVSLDTVCIDYWFSALQDVTCGFDAIVDNPLFFRGPLLRYESLISLPLKNGEGVSSQLAPILRVGLSQRKRFCLILQPPSRAGHIQWSM